MASQNTIITIARQYGSGGREIGTRLAELLGIPCYDKELIAMAAEHGNMDERALEHADETSANSLLYALAMNSSAIGLNGQFGYNMPINDKLFMLQADVIRHLAEKESCVIIGRCADYILREHTPRVSCFIYADLEARRARVMERQGIKAGEAIDRINKTDRKRSSYYNFYTGKKWGRYDNYHLAVDSGLLGVEGTARLIADCVRLKQGE